LTLTSFSRDLPFDSILNLPDVYTSFRKSVEPLRSKPRATLPLPGRLPSLPQFIPPQKEPFSIPDNHAELQSSLLQPLEKKKDYGEIPRWPEGTKSAHPFKGGEDAARSRLMHLLYSGAMTSYKDTRNGLLGEDFSTKLSAWLAIGCITARQVHAALLEFEDGKLPLDDTRSEEEWQKVEGFGQGENPGTAFVRFELLWRDYMRLCARKFGVRLFAVHGFRRQVISSEEGDSAAGKAKKKWKYLDRSTPGLGDNPVTTRAFLERFNLGNTGTGLIDASQRELLLTGYTSNRARQNVASYLSSHLGIDWRVGAEWYESMLIDYDVASNWGNWQYVAGVGNDPRQGRIFNPVKQALDYDPKGEYIKAWVYELKDVDLAHASKSEADKEKLMGLLQAWRLSEQEKEKLNLKGVEWVENPLVRINFSIGAKRPESSGERGRGRGRGRGGRSRGRGRGRGREDRPRRMGEVERADAPDS
jgi:deoxyribodipyrimidine photo-lyase